MRRFASAAAMMSLTFVVASAQHFDPERRHSIEITTGNAPLHALLASSWSSQDYYPFNETSQDFLFTPSLNLGYTYDMSEHWSFNAFLNLSGTIYDLTHWEYSFDYDDEGILYAADSRQTGTERKFELFCPTVAGDFRWKWHCTDATRLYSAIGFGLNPQICSNVIPIVPLPYLTPLGVIFGKGRMYGLGELTMSPAATLVLFGLGYRL